MRGDAAAGVERVGGEVGGGEGEEEAGGEAGEERGGAVRPSASVVVEDGGGGGYGRGGAVVAQSSRGVDGGNGEVGARRTSKVCEPGAAGMPCRLRTEASCEASLG